MLRIKTSSQQRLFAGVVGRAKGRFVIKKLPANISANSFLKGATSSQPHIAVQRDVAGKKYSTGRLTN